MAGEQEEVCVVCFRRLEIYSVGECDHPVCYECSTRMRVLCARNECPICRKDMAKVTGGAGCLPDAEGAHILRSRQGSIFLYVLR